MIEHALQRTDGVLEASVSYVAERLRLEFDSEKIERPAIIRRIQALGYAVLEEGREAGWFAEHRELILSGVADLLLLAGWLAGLAGAPRGLALGLLLWAPMRQAVSIPCAMLGRACAAAASTSTL